MPRRDGTGPMGLGPGTGRGISNCRPQNNTQANTANTVGQNADNGVIGRNGQGFGLGRFNKGGGRGRNRGV
ncbi:hypothetical protein D6827_03505 [Candidatus Parcubacteria bacterium]|nr:MAG: hypothetical protein D6827_03505 [Candidatus Parcubacteria bacterium]